MMRLLIVAGLILFVVIATRRARNEAGKEPRRRRKSGSGRRSIGPPERLVCGACGTEFDPEESGWICPKCGK